MPQAVTPAPPRRTRIKVEREREEAALPRRALLARQQALPAEKVGAAVRRHLGLGHKAKGVVLRVLQSQRGGPALLRGAPPPNGPPVAFQRAAVGRRASGCRAWATSPDRSPCLLPANSPCASSCAPRPGGSPPRRRCCPSSLPLPPPPPPPPVAPATWIVRGGLQLAAMGAASAWRASWPRLGRRSDRWGRWAARCSVAALRFKTQRSPGQAQCAEAAGQRDEPLL